MVPKWNTGKKKNGMTFRHSLFIFGSGHVRSQIVLSFRSSFVLFVCLHPVFTSATAFWVGVASPSIGSPSLWDGSHGGKVQLPYGNHRKGAPVGSITFLERQERQRKETRKENSESLIIQHKHQQWSSKKMGNVSLNRTLNPHLQTSSLFHYKSLSFCGARLAKTVKGWKYRSGANGRFFPSLLWDWAGVVYGCGTLGEWRQRQRFLGRRPERKNEGPREKKREGSVPFIMK